MTRRRSDDHERQALATQAKLLASLERLLESGESFADISVQRILKEDRRVTSHLLPPLPGQVGDPHAARAAGPGGLAFFDALVGQQDRHAGNYRWDDELGALGLIDHGYAFATAGALLNQAVFMDWRCEDRDRMQLTEKEIDTLERLLASHDLLGVAPMLAPARAEAASAPNGCAGSAACSALGCATSSRESPYPLI